MHITHLRKVGGSIMLAVPPALLDVLKLQAGATVGVTIDGGRLVLEPAPGPKYSLDELLAGCDPNAPWDEETRAWVDDSPQGRELI